MYCSVMVTAGVFVFCSTRIMADSSIPASLNGMPMDDDEFERNLKEIMDDGPDLNDMSNTVQSGSPQREYVPPATSLPSSPGSDSPAMTAQGTVSRSEQSLHLPTGTCMHTQYMHFL